MKFDKHKIQDEELYSKFQELTKIDNYQEMATYLYVKYFYFFESEIMKFFKKKSFKDCWKSSEDFDPFETISCSRLLFLI